MSDYRIRFETKDGSLIMNRKTGPCIIDTTSREYWGNDVRDYSIARDATERGVKILSKHYENKFTLVCIVDYL